MAQIGTHRDVLAHAHPGKGLRDLEGARDAAPGPHMRGLFGHVLRTKHDAAGGGELEARDQGEQGGLTCAVRADETGDGPISHRERGVADGQQTRESLRDGIEHQHAQASFRKGARRARRAHSRRTRPIRPWGARAMMRMSAMPNSTRSIPGTPSANNLVNSLNAPRHSAPASGPKAVPTPPTIGASSASMEIQVP